MKNSFLIVVGMIFAFGCKEKNSQLCAQLRYSANLNSIEEDRLSIVLDVASLKSDTVTFCFPKIVPGIYGAMDYGMSISNIVFKNSDEEVLLNRKLNENCWEIYNANKLNKITYEVDDNWEEYDSSIEGFYQSANSSFQEDVFVLNHNTLFGYFRGFENLDISIEIEKDPALYASTGLELHQTTGNTDLFKARSYHQLVDNPILYATPDTTRIKLPGIDVTVSCYSKTGVPISREIAEHIKPLLINQSKYLKNTLPVDHYTFIIYHALDVDSQRALADGLEHSQSTLILLNSPLNMENIKNTVHHIASHEFFHILMPLGVHSKEIADYDFNEPKFSKHIWLYEGMTEYFTMHMPIKNGLISLEEFTKVIESKFTNMQNYDQDLSFVELSLNPMQRQDQYYNVYLKGALLNLCLDIELREFSEGKFGVQELVLILFDRYGPNKAFEDDDLFEEIEKITQHPEIMNFFEDYVFGVNELPLQKYLFKVGLELKDDNIKSVQQLSHAQRELRKYWIGQ